MHSFNASSILNITSFSVCALLIPLLLLHHHGSSLGLFSFFIRIHCYARRAEQHYALCYFVFLYPWNVFIVAVVVRCRCTRGSRSGLVQRQSEREGTQHTAHTRVQHSTSPTNTCERARVSDKAANSELETNAAVTSLLAISLAAGHAYKFISHPHADTHRKLFLHCDTHFRFNVFRFSKFSHFSAMIKRAMNAMVVLPATAQPITERETITNSSWMLKFSSRSFHSISSTHEHVYLLRTPFGNNLSQW